MEQKKVYRGIVAVKNQKTLVEFTNKLQVCDVEHFSRLLGENSKIGVTIQDYSAGTGDKNVIVEANITPEEAQFLFEQAKAICYFQLKRDFSKSWTKVFGEYVDENGKKDGNAIVTKLWVSRASHDSKGNPMRYPWTITIENGKGMKKDEENSLVPNTYVCLKKAKKQLSDEDLIEVLRRVDSCIREFEGRAAGVVFDSAYKRLQAEREIHTRL